jgi:hypothetical protein
MARHSTTSDFQVTLTDQDPVMSDIQICVFVKYAPPYLHTFTLFVLTVREKVNEAIVSVCIKCARNNLISVCNCARNNVSSITPIKVISLQILKQY